MSLVTSPPGVPCRRAVALALALASALAALPGNATMVDVPDLPTMHARAAVVARVHVVDQREAVVHSRAAIVTRLEVKEAFKGAAAGETLSLYQPRGRAGRGALLAGAHAFHVGDDVIVFLGRFTLDGTEYLVQLGPGYGVFGLEGGAVRELGGDVVDIRSGAPPTPRVFASLAAFRAALDPQGPVRP